ncbi:MAG: hypothetical protein PHI12_14650, partial [Dehalococcoidales bacterium]|nr:hypothetical protein [Dehalococcoidales bacterium]
MPKTDIRSYWSSGDLIFYEKGHRADEDYHVLEIADGEVIVGNADNDVDFIVYLGAADQYVKFDCGTAAVSFAKVDVTITGDLTAGGLAIAGAAVTINDAGADLDFRVESDNLAYALYLDGGKDSL